MTFEKAISILGLSPNFIESELKSAYRRLSNEYHPDKYEGTNLYESMQRKQQEINAAKEFLRKYLQTKPKTNSFNINVYIRQKKDELKKIITYDVQTNKNEDFTATLNAIKKTITEFEAKVFNPYVIRKEDVDIAYNECMTKIKVKLDNFKSFFYKRNHINKEEVKDKLNYDCTLEEFYEQLQQIESKYGEKSKIKELLLLEVQKYQYFAGYEKLETLINISLNNVLIKIKQNNFKDVQRYIDEMHQEILGIFQTYHMQALTIRELSQEVYATKNESIIKAYEKLKQDFQRGSSFNDIALEIKRLQSLIQEHNQEIEKAHNQLKKVMDFKNNEQTINKIYKSLIDRYNKVIKNYNIITEYDAIIKLQEFLQQILKIFVKGCEELQDLEYFNVFNNITFTDIDNDKELIQDAIQTTRKYPQNQNNSNDSKEPINKRTR